MKIYFLFFINGLILTVLAGCLGMKSTPAKYFLLTSMPMDTESLLVQPALSPAVGVSKTVIPAFLDRPQMVTSRSSNQISYAEFERWAEPLEEGFTRVLRENLGRLLEPEKVYAHPWSRHMRMDYSVNTVVSKLTADLNAKEVELVVFWRISGAEGRVNFVAEEKIYSAEIQGSRADYSNVAQGMSDAIALLSEDVAQAVLELEGRKYE